MTAGWQATRAYLTYFGQRLVVGGMTLLGLMTLVFIMVKVIPGDEARVAAGPEASAAQVEVVRERMGLDQPVVVQYARFIGRIVQSDLGTSISTRQPVLADLGKVLPGTIELVIVSMALCLLLAVPAATAAAAWRDKGFDMTSRVVAVVLGGMPAFWLALLGQYLLGSRLHLLPISGQLGFEFMVPAHTGMPLVDTLIEGDSEAFLDAVAHIILPAAALALGFAAQLFRTLRASLIAILQSDFIVPVRAKGVASARIMLRHALPNAMGPAVNLAGMQLGLMIGSAVLVEGIFARPGVGSYLANGVAQKDTYAVLGTVLFVGAAVCIVNIVVDILLLALDPRVRAAQFRRARG